MNYNYLISSPSRCGSQYLTYLLLRCGVSVQSTHQPLLEVDYSTTRLILLYRRDRFATVMSRIIWQRTREENRYTYQQLRSFAVTKDEFDMLWSHTYHYYSKHDFTRPYVGVYRVVFEDVLKNTGAVLDQFGLKVDPVKAAWQQQQQPWAMQRCPYRYQEIVSNHDECWQWHQERERSIQDPDKYPL